MNILPNIIGSMNKEEIRNFKLFINRTNSNKNRKDEALFDLIKYANLRNYDEEKIYKKLYEDMSDKNSFYRLKNRLLEDIGISLSQFYFNQTDLHYILNHYLLYKSFSLKNEWQSAKFYLGKAQKKAESIENYQLLDLLYSEMILLSHEILDIDPDHYINKRKLNRTKLSEIQELDDILATIIYKVKKTQNFSGPETQVSEVLNTYIDHTGTNKKLKHNIQFRFKMYDALSRVLLSKKDYKGLEAYLMATLLDFTKDNLFTKNTHDSKLHMLAYMANALFMNQKYSESIKYADKLHLAMQEYDKLLFDKYIFFYYNILVNNYSKTDPEKALEPLNEARSNKAIMNHSFYMGYVYLNLGVTLYNLKDYKQALKSFIKLYTNANYKLLDETFRFNISMAELIIRYRLNDPDYILTRIAQMQKDFKEVIRQPFFRRDKEFLGILKMLIISDSKNTSKKTGTILNSFINNHHKENSSEILSYDEFLESFVIPKAVKVN